MIDINQYLNGCLCLIKININMFNKKVIRIIIITKTISIIIIVIYTTIMH